MEIEKEGKFDLNRELDLIQKMYNNFIEEKKEEIKKNLLKSYLEDLNIEYLNPIQKKIFNRTVKLSYYQKNYN